MWFAYKFLDDTNRPRYGFLMVPPEYFGAPWLWAERKLDVPILACYRLPSWVSPLIAEIKGKRELSVSKVALAQMLRDLAVMSKAGISIFDAVSAVAEDSGPASKKIAELATLLSKDLQAGYSLSDAFQRRPTVFPEVVCSLALLGDETGSMDQMLMEAAEHLERINSLKADAGQALVYPAIVLLSIFGAGLFWLYYVIPNVTSLFKQMNAKLPPMTIFVMGVADWAKDHYLLVALLSLGAVISPIYFWSRSIFFRKKIFLALHVLPVSRAFVKSAGLAFFCEHLALLLRSGLDVMRSLAIVEKTTGDDFYRDRVKRIRELVARGSGVGGAIATVGGFPPILVRMVTVGERTGTMDKQLSYLAEDFRRKLERLVATLSEIITPVLILIAGGIFLVMISVLMAPVYDLVRQSLAIRG